MGEAYVLVLPLYLTLLSILMVIDTTAKIS